MNFLLPTSIWPIYRLLRKGARREEKRAARFSPKRERRSPVQRSRSPPGGGGTGGGGGAASPTEGAAGSGEQKPMLRRGLRVLHVEDCHMNAAVLRGILSGGPFRDLGLTIEGWSGTLQFLGIHFSARCVFVPEGFSRAESEHFLG